MSFCSPTRDQEWRNFWRSRLHIWETSFDHSHSLIPKEELRQTPPHSHNNNFEYVTLEASSDYQPSSSPFKSLTGEGHQVPTRSQASCAPSRAQRRSQLPDSSGSNSNQVTGRKRGFSQVTSSPSDRQADRQQETGNNQGNHYRSCYAQFCTQRCLLGLQTGDILDDSCPNMKIHRQGGDGSRHPINAEALVRLLKAQLDENIDRCSPIGSCGAYGAPFKLTCATYGYTVVGKGTTSELWKDVSREAQVYQVLWKAQGSAVPVFLGMIDLAKIYFLHGAGEIRHMLVMGWGGENTTMMELAPWLHQEIHRSNKEIKALGIIHKDLRGDNILWNKELRRVLIINFHHSTLKCLPTSKRPQTAKRQLCWAEPRDVKRLQVL